MIYGYARVSTDGQARDGNSLGAQVTELKNNGCEKVFCDSFTGTKMDRPEFNKLIGLLQAGDRLIVTKLDRFARTVSGGIDCIRDLLSRGVSVHILNMGLIDNTPTGRLMVTMLLAFAEFERDMIVERTTIGKQVARAKNPAYKEGRKEKFIDQQVFLHLVEQNKKGEMSVAACCKYLNISKGTWYNRLKEIA